jgi:hypothetical protein
MMEEGTVVYSDDTKPQNCHKLGGAKCRDQAGVVSHRGEPPKADICGATWHVRFGSEADMCGAKWHVRFTPESGHSPCN